MQYTVFQDAYEQSTRLTNSQNIPASSQCVEPEVWLDACTHERIPLADYQQVLTSWGLLGDKYVALFCVKLLFAMDYRSTETYRTDVAPDTKEFMSEHRSEFAVVITYCVWMAILRKSLGYIRVAVNYFKTSKKPLRVNWCKCNVFDVHERLFCLPFSTSKPTSMRKDLAKALRVQYPEYDVQISMGNPLPLASPVVDWVRYADAAIRLLSLTDAADVIGAIRLFYIVDFHETDIVARTGCFSPTGKPDEYMYSYFVATYLKSCTLSSLGQALHYSDLRPNWVRVTGTSVCEIQSELFGCESSANVLQDLQALINDQGLSKTLDEILRAVGCMPGVSCPTNIRETFERTWQSLHKDSDGVN